MHKLIFVADAFIAAAFGIGLLAAPQLLFETFGLRTNAGGEFLAQLVGVFVLALAPLLWSTRDSVATPQGLAITRAHALQDVLGAAVCTSACVRGLMNPAGWFIAAMFAVFGAARIYYGFVATPALTPRSA